MNPCSPKGAAPRFHRRPWYFVFFCVSWPPAETKDAPDESVFEEPNARARASDAAAALAPTNLFFFAPLARSLPPKSVAIRMMPCSATTRPVLSKFSNSSVTGAA